MKNERTINIKSAHFLADDLVCSRDAEINELASLILDEIYKELKPKRKHSPKHTKQLSLLISNFIVASIVAKGFIAIPRSANYYKGLALSYKILICVLMKFLHARGYVYKYNGFYTHGDICGSVTRYELVTGFKSLLSQYEFSLDDFSAACPKELIILKDSSKKIITIPAHLKDQAASMTENLALINFVLEQSNIDLDLSKDQHLELLDRMRAKVPEDPYQLGYFFKGRKYLQRKFNNGSFSDGGRFYKGWWLSIPQEYRPFILINGNRTVELDYKAMHPTMLYAMEGLTLEQDPYDIEDNGSVFRDVTKLVILVMLNASSRSEALNTVKNMPKIRELRKGKHPRKIKNFDQFLTKVEKRLSPIKRYFYSGYGVKLQAIDSNIIEEVMLRMINEHQAVCLPVHDSLIVEEKHRESLRICMHEVFIKHTGHPCRIEEK